MQAPKTPITPAQPAARPARAPWNKGKLVGAKPPLRSSDYAMDCATIRQRRTGRPVRSELTDQTRVAIDDDSRRTGRKPGQFQFEGRGARAGLTTRQ